MSLPFRIPTIEESDLSFDLVFGEDSRSFGQSGSPSGSNSGSPSTSQYSPPHLRGKSSDDGSPEVRERNREREIERDRNSILFRSTTGESFNITSIIRSIEKSLPLTIKTYHYRDKQTFCFMQFHSEADANAVVDFLNSKAHDSLRYFSAQRVARVTPGKDPFDTESSAESRSATLVIKNLPFSLKHEQLKAVLSSYEIRSENVSFHYDASGMFRGMAFVKYATPEEASEMYDKINGLDVGGRSIRVEFKKNTSEKRLEYDPSDEEMKKTYEQLYHFKTQSKLPILSFPSTLTSYQRRQIHIVANKLDLDHYSEGEGDNRYLIIAKRQPTDPVRTSPSFESFMFSQTSTSPLPSPSAAWFHTGASSAYYPPPEVATSSSWRERDRKGFGFSPSAQQQGRTRRSSISSVTSPIKSPHSTNGFHGKAASPVVVPQSLPSSAHRSRSISTKADGARDQHRVYQSLTTGSISLRPPLAEQPLGAPVCLPTRQPTGPNPNAPKGFSEGYQKQRMIQICHSSFSPGSSRKLSLPSN